MPFPVPAHIAAQLDSINRAVEEAFKAGELTRMVQLVYHENATAFPVGQSHKRTGRQIETV